MANGRDFYAGSRAFEWLAMLVGLPIDQFNFLICQFIALMLAIVYKKVLPPNKVTPQVRHTVALLIGIVLGYFCFGHQISHLCLLGTISYIIMNSINPQIMHRGVLFVALLYLSSLHLLRLTYDYGGWTLDITGPAMIATQKVSSVAFSLHDGLARSEENLSLDQKRYVIRQSPSVLEFFSYIFHFQGLMCGPLMFYNDYITFIEGKSYNRVKHPQGQALDETTKYLIFQGPPLEQVIQKITVSIFFALFLVIIVPHFPITYLTEEKFLNETPWLSQMFYIIVATSVVRSKYYHAWLLGEAVCNAAGQGFNGFTSGGQPRWDLMSNVDIVRFEMSVNFRESLETWNKTTQVWLKSIAYDRAASHKTLLTYILSAIWHGFYPGYYFTFLGGALLTVAARSVRRSVRPYFQTSKPISVFYDILSCLATRVALAYIVFPFILLESMASLKVYWNFYFLGHIIALLAIFVLPIVLPPQTKSGKSSSAENDQRISSASDTSCFSQATASFS
ncbi:lysophospholipid acyltransferase 2-like [Limulus polyphemus]|uniref:Lysophospholipid acyltransferase 2-like n=1 Tax=Limulus polyphemus TaxID=6850 RepID=A0ABM1B8S8_LIMPO|nr:lysophospholipid acyltransferase 2-like [Limulus polyphemus]